MPDTQSDLTRAETPVSFAEFLESVPPGRERLVERMAHPPTGDLGSRGAPYMNTPRVEVFCGNEKCGGPRVFRCINTERIEIEDWDFFHCMLEYKCANCRSIKLFALKARRDGRGDVYCYKLGEFPEFGPPSTPQAG